MKVEVNLLCHPQVDLGEERTVYGVAVQGYHSSSYYISSFKISHSVDGNLFVYAKNRGSDVSKYKLQIMLTC